MEFLGWVFGFMFWAMYIVCLFTVCLLTFQKGHTILGVLGFFLPLLWLIGAVLPAKPGSRHELAQEARFQDQARQGST
jgi:threonine/homoserine/homoserine lactone efflux protein